MKRMLTPFLLLVLGAPLFAGDLEDRRDAKLEAAWISKQAPWMTDYSKVKAEAKKTGKLIFAYFTRSYAY